MPYRNKQMLRDANGDLIPQYWDVVEQEFKPLTGSDGANDVRLTGSIVEKIVVVNNEAYADDRLYNYPLDVSKYKQVIFLAYHTMDKPPTIGLRIPNSEHPIMVYKNNEWNRQDSSYGITLTSANRFMYILNSYWDFLDQQAFESINLTVRLSDGIPTTGALNVTMLGVLR